MNGPADDAANRSQPIRSEPNRPSSPAGSPSPTSLAPAALMKKLIAIILLAELLMKYFVSASSFVRRQFLVRRQAHVLGFMDWLDNQTPQTRAELDRRNQISDLYRGRFSAAAFCVMAGATLFGARACSREHAVRAGLRDENDVV